MGYVIRLRDGYYVEQRGGFDWGRTCQGFATVWSDYDDCLAWANYTGGMVESQ